MSVRKNPRIELSEKAPLSEGIIEFQLEEIRLKKMEIELKKKQTDNNYEFAKESLKYQAEDYKDLRKREISKEKSEALIIFLTILLFFMFIIAAMILNKDELLSDMIRVSGYVFGGGLTGYGIGLQKLKSSKNKTGKFENGN